MSQIKKNIPWKWFPRFAESGLFWSASAHAAIDRWYVWCIAIDGVFKTLSKSFCHISSQKQYIYSYVVALLLFGIHQSTLECTFVKVPVATRHGKNSRSCVPVHALISQYRPQDSSTALIKTVYLSSDLPDYTYNQINIQSAAVIYELLQMKHWSTILNPGLTKQWWDIYLQITQITKAK